MSRRGTTSSYLSHILLTTLEWGVRKMKNSVNPYRTVESSGTDAHVRLSVC